MVPANISSHGCSFHHRRLCSVSAVLLSERLFVPTTCSGGKTQHGPDRGWGTLAEATTTSVEGYHNHGASDAPSGVTGGRRSDVQLCLCFCFRGISVVDVERPDFSLALPLFWSCEYKLPNDHRSAHCCFVPILMTHAVSWLRTLRHTFKGPIFSKIPPAVFFYQ